MNKVIAMTLLTFLTMAQVNASTYISTLKGLSFDQLRANYDVELENDQIWFDGSLISILDTCMSNESTIRTLHKVDIEIQDQDDFEVIGHDYLYKSVNSTRAIVSGDDVIEEDYVISTTRKIYVTQSDMDMEGELLFVRDFSIPTCD